MRLERCCSFGPAAACKVVDTPGSGSTALTPEFPTIPSQCARRGSCAAAKSERHVKSPTLSALSKFQLWPPSQCPDHTPGYPRVPYIENSPAACALPWNTCVISKFGPHRRTEMAIPQADNDNHLRKKPVHRGKISPKGTTDPVRARPGHKMALRAIRIKARR